MAQIKSDNPLERQIVETKGKVAALEVRVVSFMSSYASLPPKERSRHLSDIQQSISTLRRFFETFQIALVVNAGARFTFENSQNSFNSIVSRWRKFESQL